MAKDPAVLFYTSDFLSGTRTMKNEEVGMYITLLCLQHQYGKLTEQDMQSICNGYNEKVYSKFEKDGDYYFNKRMHEESVKRSKYSESRRNNAKVKKEDKHMHEHMYKHMPKHMENENENENINIDSNINTINKKKKIKKVDIYRSFLHLTITKAEVEKLKANYSITKIDQTLDAIENYRNNKNYTSLYLTCKKWLEKEQNNKTQMVY